MEAPTWLAPFAIGVLNVVVAAWATAHAVLRKRDPRAALGWIVVIWLAPLLGSGAYALIGVNRIRRRAKALSRPRRTYDDVAARAELLSALGPEAAHLTTLAQLGDRIMRRPIVDGSSLEPLIDGDEAYPVMLEAIAAAKRSITLATYIFDPDDVGQEFIAALAAARERGVEVRVLVDTVGLRYAWPRSAKRLLEARGVRAERFLPTRVPWRLPYMNLRLHKKSLVVDGELGFCGGMNIRHGHALERQPASPARDIHFRVRGPVVRQLQDSFAEDWEFTTGEELKGEAFFPELSAVSDEVARVITAGPDEDFEKLRWAYLGALGCARDRVIIVTPYFLPDAPLISALSCAALRGVTVDIVLPETCNLALPQWASRATLWQVLEHGCRVFLTPPPFDHSKLVVVDGAWTLLGSGNWDPRSYRLSFELDVECYSEPLASRLTKVLDERIAGARPLTLAEVDSRPLFVRLRDGAARLLSPYL